MFGKKKNVVDDDVIQDVECWKMYCIYDPVAKKWSFPFFQRNDDSAIREMLELRYKTSYYSDLQLWSFGFMDVRCADPDKCFNVKNALQIPVTWFKVDVKTGDKE